MCQYCLDAAGARKVLGRRGFLQLAGAAASLTLLPHSAHAKTAPKPENVISPDGALARLINGNHRYIAGIGRRYDFQSERAALSGGQNPFAAILSCADSRIAPEFSFDTARGDVFFCRVGGNFATSEITASLEYAVQVLNTPLIMVLGHEACGAVDATIKSIKDGTTLPGHLPSLVHALTPAVQDAQGKPGDLLANAIRRNVAINVDKIKSSTPILQSFVNNDKLHVVGGVYALKT